MPHSRYIRPVNTDLRCACISYLFLILIAASLAGCISIPRSAGVKREWLAPAYTYNPNVAGKCLLTDLVNKHTIDCDEPKMYEMMCTPLVELKKLETGVINQCEVWR